MRRLLAYIALLAVLAPGAALGQSSEWSADQDGMNFACYDVGSYSANNLTGGGTLMSVPGTGEIVNGGPPPIATWSLTGVRVFAVSPTGSDSNQCWADSPDTTQANVEIATAAAGAKPCLTLAGAAAEVPAALDNRQAYVIAKAGTYTDGLGVFNHAKGGTLRFRCTGTGSTASATAFTGDTNDLTFEGAVTTAGMNAAGYNPTSSGTGTVLTLQLAGGGAPGFGAEPAAPLMRRLRFDSATTTVALRNAVFSIIEVPASNQVRIPTSITYASTDVAYIEDPGCVTSGFAVFDGAQSVSLSGWSVGIMSVRNGGTYSASFVNAASGTTATNVLSLSAATAVLFQPSPLVGPSVLGPLNVTGGSVTLSANSALMTGNTNFIGVVSSGSISSSNVFSGTVFLKGNFSGSTQPGSGLMFGDGANNSSPQTAVRFLSNIQLQGASVTLDNVSLPNTTDSSGIFVMGECSLRLLGPIYGGLKTDSGIDISAAVNSRIEFYSSSQDSTRGPPALTGVNGDIGTGISNLADGFHAYLSWDWLGGHDLNMMIGSNLLAIAGGQMDAAMRVALPTYNMGPGTIPPGSVVCEQFTDGNGVIACQADSQAHLAGGIGIAISALPPFSSGIAGYAVYSGFSWALAEPGLSHPVTNGSFPAYVSATNAGTWTYVRPTTGLVRRIGWSISENTLQITPDNNYEPISQVYSAGTLQHTEPGLNFGSEFTYADNAGALRGDVSINAISTTKVAGILPLGQVGSPSGTGFWHITGGTSDGTARAVDLSGVDVTNELPLAALAQGGASTTNVLSWNGTAWVPAAASGGLGDPGANGIVVRTALNTTAARTLTSSGATITITNANGVSGNPNVDVNLDGVTLNQGLGGVVQVANGGIGTTQLASSAVTYAKIQNVAGISVLGNAGTSAAAVAEITATAGTQCLQTNSGGTAIVWAACPSGGGGGVTSLAATDPVTVSASTGSVTIGSKIDNSTITLNVGGAEQRGHISGGGLDIPAGSNTSTISGLSISQITPPTGTGLWGITSGSSDAAATVVSTGLTRAAGNLTVNLSTGVAGGQTAIGGTASGNNLVLESNPSHNGQIQFGTTAAYDEANQMLLAPVGSGTVPGYAFEGFPGNGFSTITGGARVSVIQGGTRVADFLPGLEFLIPVGSTATLNLSNGGAGLIKSSGSGTFVEGSFIAFDETALATTATSGFVNLPSATGVPTGTPATIPTGQIPIVVDSTDDRLYFRNASWKPYGQFDNFTGLVKSTATTGVHSQAVAGTDYQAPLTACTDYVSLACVSGATDLGGTNATPTVIGLKGGATDHPIDTLTSGQCMAIDAVTGHVVTVACSGGGTVTSVTGTAGRIVVTPTTPTPVVDLATFGTASTCAWANVVTDAWGRTTCTANSAPQPAGNYITALSHDVAATGPGSVAAEVTGITDASSVDHQVAAAFANNQAIVINGTGAIITEPFQAPLTACTDYVSLTCVSGATDLGGSNATPTVIGAENDAAMRGDLLATAIAAPATPAAGKARIYVDSTSNNLAVKNDAGTVNHGIQTQACSSHNFATATTDSGALTCNALGSGDVTCGSLPALTGSATSTAGSCATKVVALNDGSGVQWPTSGTWANGSVLVTAVGDVFAASTVSCGNLPALTGDVTTSSGSCATTIPTKGKAFVNASDATAHSPDYLTSKIVSQTGTVDVSAISSNSLLSLDAVPSISFLYFIDTGGLAIPANGWLTTSSAFGGYSTATEYGLSMSLTATNLPTHVTLTITSYVMTLAGTTPTFTLTATQNGVAVPSATITLHNGDLGQFGVDVSGVSISAGDSFGLQIGGTYTGSGTSWRYGAHLRIW